MLLCRLEHTRSLEVVFNASSYASDIQRYCTVCFGDYSNSSNSITYSTVTHYLHLINVQTFIHVWDVVRLHSDCVCVDVVISRWQLDFLWSGQQREINSMQCAQLSALLLWPDGGAHAVTYSGPGLFWGKSVVFVLDRVALTAFSS